MKNGQLAPFASRRAAAPMRPPAERIPPMRTLYDYRVRYQTSYRPWQHGPVFVSRRAAMRFARALIAGEIDTEPVVYMNLRGFFPDDNPSDTDGAEQIWPPPPRVSA